MAAFNLDTYLAKHGQNKKVAIKLTTGHKLTLKGFPKDYSVPSLIKLAGEQVDDTKVSLPKEEGVLNSNGDATPSCTLAAKNIAEVLKSIADNKGEEAPKT